MFLISICLKYVSCFVSVLLVVGVLLDDSRLLLVSLSMKWLVMFCSLCMLLGYVCVISLDICVVVMIGVGCLKCCVVVSMKCLNSSGMFLCCLCSGGSLICVMLR